MPEKAFEDVMSEKAADKLYEDIMKIARLHAVELNEMDELESA